jgi:hypothetical protein
MFTSAMVAVSVECVAGLCIRRGVCVRKLRLGLAEDVAARSRVLGRRRAGAAGSRCESAG